MSNCLIRRFSIGKDSLQNDCALAGASSLRSGTPPDAGDHLPIGDDAPFSYLQDIACLSEPYPNGSTVIHAGIFPTVMMVTMVPDTWSNTATRLPELREVKVT